MIKIIKKQKPAVLIKNASKWKSQLLDDGFVAQTYL